MILTTTLQELRKEPHLSASSINSYIECSLAYRFSKVDRIQPEKTSAEMLLGSAIHRTLQVFYDTKKEGDRLPLPELLHVFEVFWLEETESWANIEYKEGKSLKSMLEEGQSLLKVFDKELPADSFKVLATEEAFSFQLDGLPVPVIGQIDLLEEDENGTLIISDFKTASRSYSSDEVDKSFQLTVYQLAAKSIGYQDREILLRFDCLVKTKTPKFEQHYTIRTEEDEQRAVKKIKSVWEAISKEVFIPNDTSWKCQGCEYSEACKEWFTS